MPGRTYLYLGNVFRQLPYSLAEVLEAWERERLAPIRVGERRCREGARRGEGG